MIDIAEFTKKCSMTPLDQAQYLYEKEGYIFICYDGRCINAYKDEEVVS